MGTQITRLTRLAAAGLSAVLLFATTACAATSPAETEPDNKTSVPAPTGPINVVVSLNQWGSLAAELGGDDVEVTSIVNSTNVDAIGYRTSFLIMPACMVGCTALLWGFFAKAKKLERCD